MRTMGTVALIGALVLSLNALAVSARPGASLTAETTTVTASAVSDATLDGGPVTLSTGPGIFPPAAPSPPTMGTGLPSMMAPDPVSTLYPVMGSEGAPAVGAHEITEGPIAAVGAGTYDPNPTVEIGDGQAHAVPGDGIFPPSGPQARKTIPPQAIPPADHDL